MVELTVAPPGFDGVRWPLAGRSAHTSAGAGPAETRSTRVLVVEDEYLEAVFLEQELQAAGYQVVGPVHTLEAALEAARTGGFELAILDINLRGERVYPAAQEIAALGIPIVFLSGYLAADMPESFRTVPRLSKPHDPATLLRTLRKALEP